MMEQLNIKNFRVFENLQLGGLKRVNLFAGKNNTGKTFLLEALRIWAAQGDSTVVNHLLAQRGQFTPGWDESYDALFYRPALEAQKDDDDLFIEINQLKILRKRPGPGRTVFALKWDFNEKPHVNSNVTFEYPKDQAVFVPFGNTQVFPLTGLWDKIVLTPLEDDVMQILKETVLPDLVRLDVKKDRTLVRIAGESTPLPLQTFGDGVTRMLLLATALVSAKNKLLLIDEIEAGLHHSVMEPFWDLIFHYSRQWNIQVFATTHSHDTLKTFTYTLEKPANKEDGAFFRFQQARKTGKIEAVEYSVEELETSLVSNLEPR